MRLAVWMLIGTALLEAPTGLALAAAQGSCRPTTTPFDQDGDPGAVPGSRSGGPNGLHPLGQPYELDGEVIGKPDSWRLWWEFNRPSYLQIESDLIWTPELESSVMQTVITPLRTGGPYELVKSSMVAVASLPTRAEGAANGKASASQVETCLSHFLRTAHSRFKYPAIVALAEYRGDAAIPKITSILHDDEDGRELTGQEQVPTEMRAFAAYGLGLIGQKTLYEHQRRGLVQTLVHTLESEQKSPELQLAAMTAIGLISLPVVRGAEVCYCGTCEVESPETSLQAQVTYLMRYFNAAREFPPATRARTATTLARLLLENRPDMPALLESGVAELLIEATSPTSREPIAVRESSVIGLGMIGDASATPVNRWIRWALARSIRTGAPLERRFALISLAKVGARAGSDDGSIGAADARTELLHHLKRGRKGIKPWAGLALGVLGHRLRERGIPLDGDVDAALRSAIKRTRADEDVAAFALASGLRGDEEAMRAITLRLKSHRKPLGRAYGAIAAALICADGASELVLEIFEGGREDPVLSSYSAFALGLTGNHEHLAHLLSALRRADTKHTSALPRAFRSLASELTVQELEETITDPELAVSTRAAALEALGHLAGPPESWRARLALGRNYRLDSPTWTSPSREGILDM